MLDLWLIRHGETDWNSKGLIQGSSDIPLNEVGVRQAQSLHERLKGTTFDRVYTSDLQRAHQPAKIVFPTVLDICPESRLREINMGCFEGRRWLDLTPEEKALHARGVVGPYHLRIPGGESSDDLQARLRTWRDELPTQGVIAAVAHGGSIGAILFGVIGRPTSRDSGVQGGWGFRFENTSITRLQITNGHVRVQTVNDASHVNKH